MTKEVITPENKMLIDIHSARGEMYAFLSRVFSNIPDEEVYQMLTEIAPKLKILKENTDNEEIKTGVDGLTEFLQKRNTLTGEELREFELERSRHYTTLLCLPKSVPTDESIYTSPEHKEREESHDKVLALYAKYGLKRNEKIPENADFIGYELLFMSKLAYDCAEFVEKDEMEKYKERIQAQYDFHVNHLDKWVYDFYNTVIHRGISDEILYKYFAHLARGFGKEDKITLEELLLLV